MELRDYQKDLIERFFYALDNGYKAPCIVLPCGGGKSVILAEIARRYTSSTKNVLFLVHRQELVRQIYSTFVNCGVQMDFCKIAMVQTLTRHVKSTRKPDLIITDENHHSLAKSYKRIYDYFSDVPRIGVTATPERIDGSGLQDVNDILLEGVTAKWLIENHFLAPYDYYAPAVEMPKFHTRNGDFIQSEVADFFEKNRAKIYGDVIKHYRKIADGKQTICYLPTVEFSRRTAENFTANGIPSVYIDGTTPQRERDQAIENFRQGKIKILCNVDIVSEGFDVPDCECVILLRPTKSLVLYTQQSMRCMRYKPGKRAIIIDHVNNIGRFGFPDREREWLLEGHPHKKGESEQPMKVCKMCYAAVPISTRVCPICGAEFDVEKHDKQKVDTDLVKLDSAKNRVKYFLTPNECTTVEELKEYAKMKGYKPGWVFYQQKQRGWLGSEKRRNENTRRYPCRAIEGWNSKT